VRWGESIAAALGLDERDLVVPSAEIRAGRGQARSQPPRLEQAVVVQAEQHRLRVLELCLGEAGREGDISVAELA